ncbi:unnamed protein product [Cuscuta campestris]|uniref:Replication protein A 70 kDa DNA-binding subunit B/D first OB fold domain-containing protein n=1 Tax=Cuscuta campestris TaxID=132261 RepID=A0A484M2U0_9ASTE|nr:unnamed protein product [Cuscuta campestris]
MELKPSSFRANLKLRLFRSYDLMSYRNDGEIYARECIFHDNEGNHILAVYQKEEIPVFGATLKEGKLYRISNPAVLSNNKPTIVSNKFKLSLGKRTTITEIVDDLFPKHVFNFKPFGEINALQNFEKAPMFDVIGALFVSDPAITKPINGKETLIMDISLEDLEGGKELLHFVGKICIRSYEICGKRSSATSHSYYSVLQGREI